MSPVLHASIAEALRAEIVSGSLPAGAALPSEARLCERFGASRGTVRTALSSLAHEGLIDRGQGRSPVVRDAPAAQPFESFLSFTAWCERIGRTPGQRTMEVALRPAGEEAATALGLTAGTPVVQVLRLRLLDGEPAMVERSSFVEEHGRLLFDFDADSGSIYAHLRSSGVPLHAAKHVIDAIGADETDAALLGVPVGTPLLRERRRAVSREGEVVEFGEDRYRPDRVTFSIDNVLPSQEGHAPDVRIIKELR